MIDNTLMSLICDFDIDGIDVNDNTEWIESLVKQCNKYVSSYCVSMTYNSIDIENKVMLSLQTSLYHHHSIIITLSSLETRIEFSIETKIW